MPATGKPQCLSAPSPGTARRGDAAVPEPARAAGRNGLGQVPALCHLQRAKGAVGSEPPPLGSPGVRGGCGRSL